MNLQYLKVKREVLGGGQIQGLAGRKVRAGRLPGAGWGGGEVFPGWDGRLWRVHRGPWALRSLGSGSRIRAAGHLDTVGLLLAWRRPDK